MVFPPKHIVIVFEVIPSPYLSLFTAKHLERVLCCPLTSHLLFSLGYCGVCLHHHSTQLALGKAANVLLTVRPSGQFSILISLGLSGAFNY